MPARIIIQSGISAGTTHWVERPVLRIGSDPRSDVCLPSADIPPHALTLEFRDGSYRIYNRCPMEVYLADQRLDPSESREWRDSESLMLNNTELALELDADPTPAQSSVQPAYELDDAEVQVREESSSVEVGPAEKPDNSRFLVQLGVTILCVFGSIGLLVRHSMKEKSVQRRKPPNFAAVVRDAQQTNTSPELVQRLQYAESASVRGNRKTARERFGQLRDDLVPQRESFKALNRTPELTILDFVEYRLGELE